MKTASLLRFLQTRAAIFLVPPALLAILFSSPVFYGPATMNAEQNAASPALNTPGPGSMAAVEPVHLFPAATHDNFSVEFTVPACSLVTIDLLDSRGNLVEHLHNEISPAGNFQSTFDITEKYFPGKYFVKTTIGSCTSYSPLTIQE